MAFGLLQRKTSKALPGSARGALISTCLMLLTLVVRVLWLRTFPAQPTEPVDAEGYFLLACNLLKGRGYAIAWDAPFCPNTVRTPLYPLFLALNFLLFGTAPQRAVLLHMLLEVLTCGIVIRLGCDLGSLFNQKRSYGLMTGTLAGLLYAINGSTQRYTGFLFAETLLLPLLTIAILISCRVLRRPTRRTALAAGVFWALAMLTKPNVQFLALSVGVVLTVTIIRGISKKKRRSLQTVAWFWFAMGLVLFPWLVRNKSVTSRWMLSSAFEENMARVAAVATQAEIMGVHAEPWTATWEHIYDMLKTQVSVQSGWLFSTAPRFSCSAAAHRQAQITQAARRLVAGHLVLYVKAHLAGVAKSLLNPGHLLWYPALTGETWVTTGIVPDIWARVLWSLQRRAVWDAAEAFITQRITHIPPLAAVVWWGLWVGRLALWFLVIRGLWRLHLHPWILYLLLGTLLYILVLPGPIAHDRFYLPAVPIVSAVAALGYLKDKS